MTRKRLGLVFVILAVVWLNGCSGPGPTGIDAESLMETQKALVEQAAQSTATMMAMQSEIERLQTAVSYGTEQAVTVAETANVALLGTLSAGLTQTVRAFTPTPTPTETPVPNTPTPTIPPIPCNAVELIEEVTLVNGAMVPPNSRAVKTWRLLNTGACGWTMNYYLVFVEGTQFGVPREVRFPANISPGEIVDLAVEVSTPGNPGRYRGYWVLRDSGGVEFGLNDGGDRLLVDILVERPVASYVYDFAANYCLADWTSGAGRLPCQGDAGDTRGSVRWDGSPQLENGQVDNEAGLYTRPQIVTNGIIRGKYPSVRVEAGHHFAAVIGCEYRSDGCEVDFQLDYQIGSGPILTLASWRETYNETFQQVDVDLSSLAGSDVSFILTVVASGPATQDRAVWLAPRIVVR